MKKKAFLICEVIILIILIFYGVFAYNHHTKKMLASGAIQEYALAQKLPKKRDQKA